MCSRKWGLIFIHHMKNNEDSHHQFRSFLVLIQWVWPSWSSVLEEIAYNCIHSKVFRNKYICFCRIYGCDGSLFNQTTMFSKYNLNSTVIQNSQTFPVHWHDGIVVKAKIVYKTIINASVCHNSTPFPKYCARWHSG